MNKPGGGGGGGGGGKPKKRSNNSSAQLSSQLAKLTKSWSQTSKDVAHIAAQLRDPTSDQPWDPWNSSGYQALIVKSSNDNALLDSGANNIFVPSLNDVTDFKPHSGALRLGDNHTINTIGTGKYGSLDVVIAPLLAHPLVGTTPLTVKYGLVITLVNKRAYIYHSDAFLGNSSSKQPDEHLVH